MKKMLLFAVAILGFPAPAHAFHEAGSIRIPGMRFYSVKAMAPPIGGHLDLLAAEQINQNDLKVFSIGEDGHLSPLAGFQIHRWGSLRLRVNALTSGDLDGDGRDFFSR